MRNVHKIIDAKGGMAALKSRPIRLEVSGFMRLVIEHIGSGPRSGGLAPASAGASPPFTSRSRTSPAGSGGRSNACSD
jgi:hypothetical protein